MGLKLREGDKVPAFTGKDQDGHTVSLLDYRGMKLVFIFLLRSRLACLYD
jgi:peroxiredoxin Q/BCP